MSRSPSLANRTGLEDQLGGFRNGHEKTGDLRVGDGHGAVGFNLLSKERDYRSGGSDNIAEADGHHPVMGNYAPSYESWGIKKEKGWNGLE
jgi:hypothetical protein